jgi:protein-tyrosine phosphatase
MTLRPLSLPPEVPGTLWLSSMPGRFSPWASFETEARRAGLALVVCLTPRDEVAELSPAYHAALAQGQVPFRWLNVPMPNFGLPEDPPAFRREIGRIAQALRDGDAVMLHCAAGLGRTGTVAACSRPSALSTQADALERVRQAGSNPQNAKQTGLVGWF